MSFPDDALVLEPGEGTAISYRHGGAIVFKARGAETEGRYALLELTLPPGAAGAPLHRHRDEAEAFYALAGAFAFQLGTDRRELSAGGFVLVPKGTAHTFWNAGSGDARCLVIVSPAGLERYFDELSALITSSPSGEPAAEQYRALCEKYGQELVEPTDSS